MSVEAVKRKGGVVYRVRWREADARPRSRVLGTKRDAEVFDADLKRLKRLGHLDQIDAGSQPLATFAEEWWRLYAAPNLARNTLLAYSTTFDRHVLPRLGGVALRDLKAERIARFRADLERARVGPGAVRKSMVILQSILARAVEWGEIPTNPAAAVRKPSGKRVGTVVAASPAEVERVRRALLASRSLRDATLVSVLAYAGLRPEEALALQWGHVRERTLLIERALVLGEITNTKTSRTRSVRLLSPLAADLAEWRLASGRPDATELVFPNTSGGLWTAHDWPNWRNRTYKPAVAAVGCPAKRPYDLRHSFASLLLHEGQTVVEVARQAGHSPTVCLGNYAHLIADLEGADKVSAELTIRAARDANVSEKCPPAASADFG